jgi:hypothetical protein
MDLSPAAKLVILVLLGPVAAAYDFVTNPAAPPQIFIAQWNEGFPNHQLPPILPPRPRRVHKTVIVTRN